MSYKRTHNVHVTYVRPRTKYERILYVLKAYEKGRFQFCHWNTIYMDR